MHASASAESGKRMEPGEPTPAGEAEDSARKGQHPREAAPISYTPPVPDGPDRPWTRGRRTRWWLVLLADTIAVAAVACFVAASVHDLARIPVLAGCGLGGVIVAWVLTWLVRRRDDHLEVAWPDGGLVIAVTWAVWLGLNAWRTGEGDVSFAVMLAVFLVVFLGGWRYLYGYVKAHDSLVPKGVQRRLDAQSTETGTSNAPKPAQVTHRDRH
ncbi:DUF3054 domain-containing protein [Actinomyces sp. MRS3W]|uniref:DUF3054 domain-containing protein n=1 Tax=Actinomyces sp. MRS3W TaxID=2800796 RepID=UPI0028FD98E0|nr:DUF3054 domain-containing protein [Actinomyces sp. MRS3W]MDU0348538.1 DUF3054 domain-containing protein [Actinomyces sp. MRS3W]